MRDVLFFRGTSNRGRQRRAARSDASPLHAGLGGVFQDKGKGETGLLRIGLVGDEEDGRDMRALKNAKKGPYRPERQGAVDAEEDPRTRRLGEVRRDACDECVGGIPLVADEREAVGLNRNDNVVTDAGVGGEAVIGALNARKECWTAAGVVVPRRLRSKEDEEAKDEQQQ